MMPAGQQMDLTRFYRCISELNQVMNRGVELSVLLETICRETTILLASETTSVLLLDRHRERLLCSAAQGLTPKERDAIAFRPGEGVAGWVIANGEPALISDTTEDPRFVPFVNQKRIIRSMITIPLVIRGQAIGCICSTHPTKGWFTKEHEELLNFLANSVVLDVENARLYRMAITDSLTGLFNRQHLAERLKEEVDRAHRYDVPLGLLMADLDHFKQVNDRYGHAAGDHVLEHVAKRLASVTREVDLVARYGGEEFIALLPNTGRDGAEQAARRIITAIRESPAEVNGQPFPLTISIGGAILGLREEPRDLLARADAALYQAKSEGRDRYVFNWLSFAGLS
jgi:diguanylate cyclase (GGDEF)-like protein